MKNLDDSFEIKVSERLFFFLSKKSKNKNEWRRESLPYKRDIILI